jgi:hypothetical protein
MTSLRDDVDALLSWGDLVMPTDATLARRFASLGRAVYVHGRPLRAGGRWWVLDADGTWRHDPHGLDVHRLVVEAALALVAETEAALPRMDRHEQNRARNWAPRLLNWPTMRDALLTARSDRRCARLTPPEPQGAEVRS